MPNPDHRRDRDRPNLSLRPRTTFGPVVPGLTAPAPPFLDPAHRSRSSPNPPAPRPRPPSPSVPTKPPPTTHVDQTVTKPRRPAFNPQTGDYDSDAPSSSAAYGTDTLARRRRRRIVSANNVFVSPRPEPPYFRLPHPSSSRSSLASTSAAAPSARGMDDRTSRRLADERRPTSSTAAAAALHRSSAIDMAPSSPVRTARRFKSSDHLTERPPLPPPPPPPLPTSDDYVRSGRVRRRVASAAAAAPPPTSTHAGRSTSDGPDGVSPSTTTTRKPPPPRLVIEPAPPPSSTPSRSSKRHPRGFVPLSPLRPADPRPASSTADPGLDPVRTTTPAVPGRTSSWSSLTTVVPPSPAAKHNTGDPADRPAAPTLSRSARLREHLNVTFTRSPSSSTATVPPDARSLHDGSSSMSGRRPKRRSSDPSSPADQPQKLGTFRSLIHHLAGDTPNSNHHHSPDSPGATTFRSSVVSTFRGSSDGGSQYYEEDGGADDSGRSSAPPSGDNATFIQQVDQAMQTVQQLHDSSDWKRMLKHKSGVQVFVQKGKSGGKKIPIFKGEGVIKGYSPASVFAVVGTRKLWDEWYEEGNLVENLNDTSSLTYMCMKGIVGSSIRDLSLAEKVEGTSNGAIYFCSTSVDTPRVPKVSGRTRAQIKLNGWVLEPTRVSGEDKPATKITYYLQVDVKTFVPAAFSSRYLARRPLCITKVDNYLQANGAPPMAGVDSAETEAGQGGSAKGGRGMSVTSIDKNAAAAAGAGAIAGGAMSSGRSRRGSVSSKRSARSVRSGKSDGATQSGIAMPAHVTADESASSFGEIQKAKDLFRQLLSDSEGGKWTSAQDRTGARIYIKEQKGPIPIVKGEASISGVSTEQVLLTVASQAAARIWDDRLGERTLLDGHNGHDQGIYLETQKGIFPHYDQRYFVCARGVERDDHSADHSQITAVARSIEHKHDEDGQGIKAKLEVSGWSIEPIDDEVHLVHIVKADLAGDKPNPFCYRIITAGTGSGPRKIRELIEQHGFAPGFVRWGQGEAELASDDGDLEKGEADFKVTSGGSKAKGGEQIAWFQWSEKMYPEGLALTVEPASAATIAKVDGLPRTLQFTWNKVPKDGVRILARRDDRGNEDSASVNGKKVRDTVAPPAGGVGGGMKKRGPSKKKPQPNGDAQKSRDEKPEPNGDAKKSAAAGAAAGAGAGGAIGAALSKAAAPITPGRAPGDQKVPHNAMIIINDDIHFTRSQVGFIFVLLGLAWAYGRFA